MLLPYPTEAVAASLPAPGAPPNRTYMRESGGEMGGNGGKGGEMEKNGEL